MMPKILICYATKYGQTEKIAHVLGRELEALGHPVDVFNIEKISPKIRLAAYQGVLVGAPIYHRDFPRSLRQWIRDHAKSMAARPSAFFAVGFGSSSKDLNLEQDEGETLDRFLNLTDWEPARTRIFAGALNYSKYGWFSRLFVRRTVRQAGLPDDGHDRELTDWAAVAAWAEEFSSLVLERWPEASKPLPQEAIRF